MRSTRLGNGGVVVHTEFSFQLESVRLFLRTFVPVQLTILITVVLSGCADESSVPTTPPIINSRPVGAPVVAGLDASDSNVIRVLRKLLEGAQASPEDGNLRGSLGLAYEANGYDHAALSSYVQAERLAPDVLEWPYLQAIMHAHRGSMTIAHECMDRAINNRTDYAPAWLTRGYWLLDEDKTEQAKQAFEKANVLGERIPAKVGLARVYLRQNHPDLAAKLLQDLTLEIDHPYIFRLLGNALRAQGKLEEARRAFLRSKDDRQLAWHDSVLDRKTEYVADFGGRMMNAETLVLGKQYAQALLILEDLVGDRPDHPTLLNLLAVAYTKTGQSDRALKVLETALQFAPDYYPIHLNLAREHHDRGAYDVALSYLDQALIIHPTFGTAYHRKAIVLTRKNRFIEALLAVEEAIQHDAREPDVYYLAGAIETRLKRWAQASDRFKQVIVLDPTFTNAHIQLARVLGEQRRFNEARVALDVADQLATDLQTARSTRLWLNQLETSGT